MSHTVARAEHFKHARLSLIIITTLGFIVSIPICRISVQTDTRRGEGASRGRARQDIEEPKREVRTPSWDWCPFNYNLLSKGAELRQAGSALRARCNCNRVHSMGPLRVGEPHCHPQILQGAGRGQEGCLQSRKHSLDFLKERRLLPRANCILTVKMSSDSQHSPGGSS